jgi:hypothetical protein
MVHQVQLRLSQYRAEDNGDAFGLKDGKRSAIPETATVANFLGNDDLTFLGHVNDCHGRYFPLKPAEFKPKAGTDLFTEWILTSFPVAQS